MEHNYSRDVIYSRMLGIVSEEELALLADKTIAVPGCGGVGYTHAETLVRMGVGGVHIADFDTFGPENFNRQFGSSIHTVGLKKADVLRERLLSINPALRISQFEDVNPDNVDQFLAGVDVLCDALDYFVIEPRIVMYRRARELGIPAVISCPIGFGGTLHFFDPQSMSFEEYFALSSDMDETQKLINFGIGLDPLRLHSSYLDSPRLDFESRKVASLSSSCLLATTLTSTFTLAKLLDRDMFFKPVPYVHQIDYMAGRFEQTYVNEGVNGLKSVMKLQATG
ncbi:ThiF family adenylyltransferase [Winslowiella iniecta]|uniref:Dinucleotide-utilizing protein n=1 Tax=Winslowiella iniecta TaxID=1560201 RepID=A0A0L7THE6_9GAMM|nr:ThiF family adenylyltransferase [Winslowiella iniecta]KOC90274.1 dinucleotide-utilizing protein [Winslowiella iniecta]KOC94764.1 dinucleotide-utilizing protein [Winslowiella iniecta]